MDKKKKDTGYRVALTSVKSILRLLIYICGIFLIVYLGKSAYDFGINVNGNELRPVKKGNHTSHQKIRRRLALRKYVTKKGRINKSLA